jgi:diaminopimelate epimerase
MKIVQPVNPDTARPAIPSGAPWPKSGIAFRKMHGLGNDFVIIDARQSETGLEARHYARIADRRLGIGCDQLIVLEKSTRADAYMRIYNPDGGEVGACGNATRCVGELLASEKGAAEAVIETRAGLLEATLGDGVVIVDMGLPLLGWAEIPLARPEGDTARVALDVSAIDPRLPGWFSAVNMGNPHAIFFVEDGAIFDLERIGPALEHHPIFPEKANISLVSPLGANAFRVRVWERAAGATLACGTAACATAVAAARLGLASGTIRIALPGGDLAISRDPNGRVIMAGPVATSFTGMIDASLLAGTAA